MPLTIPGITAPIERIGDLPAASVQSPSTPVATIIEATVVATPTPPQRPVRPPENLPHESQRENIRILLVLLGAIWHLALAIDLLILFRPRYVHMETEVGFDDVFFHLTGVLLIYIAFNLAGWMSCLEPQKNVESTSRAQESR